MLHFVIAVALGASLQEHFERAEIGDAVEYMSFQATGRYRVERKDRAGKTVARGTWTVQENRLEVKVTSCSGPACGKLGRSFGAEVSLPAESAMTVASTPADSPLSSGSYYCAFQACEKRVGVELAAASASPATLQAMHDFLAGIGERRETTVVWRGPRIEEAQPTSSVTWCRREEAKARAGAEQVVRDLAELGWVGKTQPKAGPADCLWDVRVVVGDTVSAR